MEKWRKILVSITIAAVVSLGAVGCQQGSKGDSHEHPHDHPKKEHPSKEHPAKEHPKSEHPM